jgi:hypothetical protein
LNLRISILFFFFIATLTGNGQSPYLFRILAAKGTIWINGSPANVGASLYEGDSLETKSGTSVGLVHRSGKPLEVRNGGIYSARDLEKMIPKTTDLFSRERNRRSLEIDWGKAPANEGIYTITSFPHPVLFSKVTLLWCPADTLMIKEYRIDIENMFADVLTSYVSTNTYYELDLTNELLHDETALLVRIKSNEPNTTFKSAQILLKKGSQKNIDQEHVLEGKLNSNSKDPQYWIEIGDECASKKFLYSALHAYYKAMMNSNETIYKNKFNEFVKTEFNADPNFIRCFN